MKTNKEIINQTIYILEQYVNHINKIQNISPKKFMEKYFYDFGDWIKDEIL